MCDLGGFVCVVVRGVALRCWSDSVLFCVVMCKGLFSDERLRRVWSLGSCRVQVSSASNGGRGLWGWCTKNTGQTKAPPWKRDIWLTRVGSQERDGGKKIYFKYIDLTRAVEPSEGAATRETT